VPPNSAGFRVANRARRAFGRLLIALEEVRFDMRDPILAWYQYPFPEGTVYFARHLQDAETIVQIFAHASADAAKITREGWQFLWNTFGLNGLVSIARAGECFEEMSEDEQIAEELIRRSMIAGYDPVSGFFGIYSETENTFELAGR
jgi:hypothetical protein